MSVYAVGKSAPLGLLAHKQALGLKHFQPVIRLDKGRQWQRTETKPFQEHAQTLRGRVREALLDTSSQTVMPTFETWGNVDNCFLHHKIGPFGRAIAR